MTRLHPARYRHAIHYLGLLETLERRYWQGKAGVPEVLAQFDSIVAQLRQVHDWSKATGESDVEAGKICSALPIKGVTLLQLRLDVQEWIQWLTAGLVSARKLHLHSDRCRHLIHLGLAYAGIGHHHKAIACYVEAKDDISEAEQRRLLHLMINIGNSQFHLGNVQESLQLQSQALELAQTLGDLFGEANARANLGVVYTSIGFRQEALQSYEESLVIRQRIDDKRGETHLLINLGNLYLEQGKPHRAITLYRQAIPLANTIGDRFAVGNALTGIGQGLALLGNDDEATNYHEEVLLLRTTLQDHTGVLHTLSNLGQIWYQRGNYTLALSYFEQAYHLGTDVEDQNGQAQASWGLGRIFFKQRRFQEAHYHAQRAYNAFQHMQRPESAVVLELLMLIERESQSEAS